MNVNKSGLWGEVYAARYLRDHGYDILSGNFRCRMGEIDIVAQKDGIVCFIEVKARGEAPLARPMESVTAAKQKRLQSAALFYMRAIGREVSSRFDVIEVTLDQENQPVSVTHIRDAFASLD